MSLARTSSSSRLVGALTSSSSSASASVPRFATRSFTSTASTSAKPRRRRDADDPLALRKMQKFNYDDVPTLGHVILQRKREMLKYYRTIEFEIPKLSSFKQTYKPPTSKEFLEFRFQHYQGEPHPASRKVVLTVPISKLFQSGLLKDKDAQHKFLLLAGARYSNPTGKEGEGHIKISCESMPNERQNMKWCSDTFDRLVEEANQPSPELNELPLDPRNDLVRQDKRRHYLRASRPTLKDFPKEWL